MELPQTIHMPHVMLLNNAYVLVQKQHLLAKENAKWLLFSLGISNLSETPDRWINQYSCAKWSVATHLHKWCKSWITPPPPDLWWRIIDLLHQTPWVLAFVLQVLGQNAWTIGTPAKTFINRYLLIRAIARHLTISKDCRNIVNMMII